jgi:hypothetical protein
VPTGNIYLTLVARRTTSPVARGEIDISTLPSAEDPRILTPYGPDGAESSAN